MSVDLKSAVHEAEAEKKLDAINQLMYRYVGERRVSV